MSPRLQTVWFSISGEEASSFLQGGGVIAYVLVLGGDIWEYTCFSHRPVNNLSCPDSRRTASLVRYLISLSPDLSCDPAGGISLLWFPAPLKAWVSVFLMEHLICVCFAAYRMGWHLLSVVGFPSCSLFLRGFALVFKPLFCHFNGLSAYSGEILVCSASHAWPEVKISYWPMSRATLN